MINKKFLVLALLLTIATATFGQVDKEYTQTLKKMFEVSGSEESYQAAIKQMINMYKQQYSNVKTEVWEELEKEFLKASLDNLTEMLAPVYQKYMNLADLRELIKFYQTPTGKKFAQNTPFIVQESMQVGQEWGRKVGQDFAQKIKEKGY
ncbi:MAG: hypothetical protein OHK0057_35320 [Thermoflexibacter sp.]